MSAFTSRTFREHCPGPVSRWLVDRMGRVSRRFAVGRREIDWGIIQHTSNWPIKPPQHFSHRYFLNRLYSFKNVVRRSRFVHEFWCGGCVWSVMNGSLRCTLLFILKNVYSGFRFFRSYHPSLFYLFIINNLGKYQNRNKLWYFFFTLKINTYFHWTY